MEFDTVNKGHAGSRIRLTSSDVVAKNRKIKSTCLRIQRHRGICNKISKE